MSYIPLQETVSVNLPPSFLPAINCHISTFPSELLSAIFEALAYVPFHPFRFQLYRRSAFQDIMNVSQVNSLFRNVAIQNPRLWTEFPCLNITPPDFMRSIVERSYPLPFCLSYIEKEGALPTPSWGFAMQHAFRMKGLCLEVPEGDSGEGIVAQSIFSLTLRRIERCIVLFRGPRNIRLFGPSDQSSGPALHLKTLHLTNCHISPESDIFIPGQVTTIGFTYLGRVREGPWSTIPLIDCPKWSAQFATLRHLILWNCFSAPPSPSDTGPLKLPQLKTLAIGALFSHAAAIAARLEIPPQCLRTINLFILGNVSTDDARAAVCAVVPFLNKDEEFQDCRLDFNPLVPSLQCIRENARVFVRFHLFQRNVEAASSTPVDLWTLTIWKAVSEQLRRHLKSVRSLKVSFPSSELSGPLGLPLLLSAMPNVCSLYFDSFAAYSKHPVAIRDLYLTQLQKVIIHLTDGAWDDDLKAGIARFLHDQIAAGNPVREVAFVVSPALGQALGYARADGIRLMLGELVEMISSTVHVEWTEASLA